jgi:hypothetical protein
MSPEMKEDLRLSLKGFVVTMSVMVAIFWLIMAAAYYGG